MVTPRFAVTGRGPDLCDQQDCEELVKDCVQQEAGRRRLAILPCKEALHRRRMGAKELLVRACHDLLYWTRRGVKTSTVFDALEAIRCCGW